MAVSQIVGYIKGKSAIHIARNYLEQKKNYNGMHFWARGYFVSTVGTDEEVVRAYIQIIALNSYLSLNRRLEKVIVARP
ncbi:MAG: transposase IS200-family protein [uncultured bacterium]|nr:MAG: transposase IS200-family protein [uncultured bacterium]